MSKHVRSAYSKVDKKINSLQQAPTGGGLIPKRSTTDEELSPVEQYVLHLRKQREIHNAK
jgi:hypothetical protein